MKNFKHGDIVTPIHDSVYSRFNVHIEGNFVYIKDKENGYIHIKSIPEAMDRIVKSCEMQLLVKEEEYSLTF